MASEAPDDPRALHTHAPEEPRRRLPRVTRIRELGLLILRLGLGAIYMAQGLPALAGGPSRWTQLGETARALGFHLGAPGVWGFLGAAAQLACGVSIATGLLFRPACLLLALAMCVETLAPIAKGADFARTSHAAEMAVVFLSLVLIGEGAWRIRLGR